MLDLTKDAAAMIERLVEAAALPPGGGLRIAERADHPALVMSLADAAGPQDRRVQTERATVYLAPVAAERLAGSTLDARTGATGAAFYVRDAGLPGRRRGSSRRP